MDDPQVVSRDEWLAARRQLLAKEKEFARAAGRAERRAAPAADDRDGQGVRVRGQGRQEHPAAQGRAGQAWPGGAGYRPVVGMVLKVRYGLRHARRLTVLAIADEAASAEPLR